MDTTTQKITPKLLNTFLALKEKYEKTYKGSLNDMIEKFMKKQGLFMGKKATYVAIEGFADDDTKRGFAKVASTVKQQLDWFEETNLPYFKQLFTIEKTNSSGTAKAHLIIDGNDWGEFSSLELLRLKSLLEDDRLKTMFKEIPVRSESMVWVPTTAELYKDTPGIFESILNEGFSKTTLKEKIIVNDPHIKDAPNRPPITDEKSKQVNVGSYSSQEFTGAASMRERASMLKRLDVLHKAVVEALENANNVPVVESSLGDKVLSFITRG